MKSIFILNSVIILAGNVCLAQNIGIGTNAPLARLHVADSGVVFTGLSTNSLYPGIAPPVQGPGIRMLWYPEKAAFRAGFAGFNTWDRDNIGTHSFAGGQGTLAKGRSTTAFGLGAEAIGDFSSATGIYTRTQAYGGMVVGAYNNIDDNPNPVVPSLEDRIFQIGNGSANGRSNALTVLRNGNLGIGNSNPQAYGHGGTNQFIEIRNTETGANIQSHVILSSAGSSGSLGTLTWANTGIPNGGEQRTAVIANVVESGTAENPNTGLAFYTRSAVVGLAERVRISADGNVGIGISNSNAPLQFSNGIANRKIVLYELNNNDHQFYGFGINGSTLRYQTASAGDDHVFFSGASSTASAELMRITGNGNVGIGITDPAFRLDVGARMRIRATPGATAGLWLNNDANNASPAFIGMQTDNQVGFYGSGAGWPLTVNTTNGALSVAGNTGANGQVLKSNGNASSPGWTTLGNLIVTAQNKGTTGITTTASTQLVPGSNITITIAVRSRLIYSCNIAGTASYCFGCASSQALLTPFVDNTPNISVWNLVATNEPLSKATTTISNVFWDVMPGTYTLLVRAVTNPNFRPLNEVTSLSASVIAIPID